MVAYFQRLFLGENGRGGLILRERWIARDGLLERLAGAFRLAVFTGRLRDEAFLTLDRFAAARLFDPVIGQDNVKNTKPAPDGLLAIAAASPGAEIWYVGDTVDDARSARAAGARFIGIAEPSKPRHQESAALLESEGAIAVLDDINRLEEVLPR